MTIIVPIIIMIGVAVVTIILYAAWELFNWRERASIRDGQHYLSTHKIKYTDHNPWQYYDPDPTAGGSSGKDTRPITHGYEPVDDD